MVQQQLQRLLQLATRLRRLLLQQHLQEGVVQLQQLQHQETQLLQLLQLLLLVPMQQLQQQLHCPMAEEGTDAGQEQQAQQLPLPLLLVPAPVQQLQVLLLLLPQASSSSFSPLRPDCTAMLMHAAIVQPAGKSK